MSIMDMSRHGTSVCWTLLEGMPAREASEVLSRTTTRDLARGEALFWEGDAATALFLVERGHVSVRVCTVDGDQAIVRVLGPGAHVGELALLTPAPRSTSAIALDDVRVRMLHRRDFVHLRQRHPAVEGQVVAALVTESDRLAGALTDSYFLPVADRTVRRLLELAGVYGHDRTAERDGTADADAVEVLVPLTQDELAQLAGTARPTVNKVLQELQAEGLVRVSRGRIVLCDLPRLRRRPGVRSV